MSDWLEGGMDRNPSKRKQHQVVDRRYTLHRPVYMSDVVFGTVRLFLEILLVVILCGLLYSFWTHFNIVRHAAYEDINRKFEEAEAVRSIHCQGRIEYASVQEMCKNAQKLLDSDLYMLVVHEIIDEHLSHIPFYTYCSSSDHCKMQLFLFIDTLRSWFTVLMVIGVVVLSITFYRTFFTLPSLSGALKTDYYQYKTGRWNGLFPGTAQAVSHSAKTE